MFSTKHPDALNEVNVDQALLAKVIATREVLTDAELIAATHYIDAGDAGLLDDASPLADVKASAKRYFDACLERGHDIPELPICGIAEDWVRDEDDTPDTAIGA